MKFILTAFLSLCIHFSISQTFNPANFTNVKSGSLSYADIDGDNDLDVLVTGSNGANPIAELYLNLGSGKFERLNDSPLEGVEFSATAFADIDGDNDQDLIITGSNESIFTTKLYTNDGTGTYTEVLGTPFDSVHKGSVAFADIDGDTDLDLLITGENTAASYIAKLYLNDGAGNYSEQMGTTIDGVQNSAIAFADIDADNDFDLVVTGRNNSFFPTAKLYTNDGSGNFTEVVGTTIKPVTSGSVAFADVDGDNDYDLMIAGNVSKSELYLNDGSGNFSEATGTPFIGAISSSIAFADIDGDNDPDLVITGGDNWASPHSELYTNNGNGIFTEASGLDIDSLVYSSMMLFDMDGDNDLDLLIAGQNKHYMPSTRNYTNDGMGNFSLNDAAPFEVVVSGDVTFVDIDGDDDLDAMIVGDGKSAAHIITNLYTNDGTGTFTEVLGTPFLKLHFSTLAFADIDGDNDQDVIIAGKDQFLDPYTILYTNDGSGNFTEVQNTPFVGLASGSIAFSDIDGDNDQDLLMFGEFAHDDLTTRLYKNDGSGNFTEVAGTPFMDYENGTISFLDIDGDNDQDVLLTGYAQISNNIYGPRTTLYTNDGMGNFTDILSSSFEDVAGSGVDFADVDGDNDMDVFIGGGTGFSVVANLYLNDGSGTFTQSVGNDFTEFLGGDAQFADMDGDGDQDLFITGMVLNPFDSAISKLYVNDGTGSFSEADGVPFEGVRGSAIAIGDVDGNTSPDLLIIGEMGDHTKVARLYYNTTDFSLSIGSQFGQESMGYVYPNPSNSPQVNLNLTIDKPAQINITVYNLSGQLISHKSTKTVTGENTIPLNLPASTKGLYMIRVEDGERVHTMKLVLN